MPRTIYESCPIVENASLAFRLSFLMAINDDSSIVVTANHARILSAPHQLTAEGPKT